LGFDLLVLAPDVLLSFQLLFHTCVATLQLAVLTGKFLQHTKKEGRKEGREEGREEGRKEGRSSELKNVTTEQKTLWVNYDTTH